MTTIASHYQKMTIALGNANKHTYLHLVIKGQLILKANCQAVNSSKKRMNEFVFTMYTVSEGKVVFLIWS